ncbi:MAG: hypothetical protein EOO27_39195 [Comamonadaceae bacterium]|nr:MAG: hypothetical protein EOO27_39195 [Comamonadaceae bacterium]
MKFELPNSTPSKMVDIKILAKKNGQKELTPAVQLRFMVELPNSALQMFDPALRTFLYEKLEEDGAAGDQATLDGVPEVSELPNLTRAANQLGALQWAGGMFGASLYIDHGLGGASDMELRDCEVSKFKIDPKEGGTCQISFTVDAAGVDERTFGKLSLLKKHEFPIGVRGPEVGDDLASDDAGIENPFGDDDAPGDAHPPLTAEELFAGTANDAQRQDAALSSDAR